MHLTFSIGDRGSRRFDLWVLSFLIDAAENLMVSSASSRRWQAGRPAKMSRQFDMTAITAQGCFINASDSQPGFVRSFQCSISHTAAIPPCFAAAMYWP
jgi:hypothetical protein